MKALICLQLLLSVLFLVKTQIETIDLKWYRAHCKVEVVYLNRKCNEMFDNFIGRVEALKVDQAGGNYELRGIDRTSMLICAVRSSPTVGFKDDLNFNFVEEDKSCKVIGISQSQIWSYYDSYTNFCNLMRVMTPLPELYVVSECRFSYPSNEINKCYL